MQQRTANRRMEVSTDPQPWESFSFVKASGLLPLRSCAILIHPKRRTLQAEAGNARWSLVIFQLLLLVAIPIALNALGHHIPDAALHRIAVLSVSGISVFGWLPPPFNMIVFLLAPFFLGLLTAYPCSKLAKGTGTFLEHMYLLLVFTVPLVAISGLLLLIPLTGAAIWGLIGLVGALLLYRLVLHGLTIVAVHHVSGEKATLIVLILPMLLVLLLVVIGLAHLDFPDFDLGFDIPERKKHRKQE